MHKATMYRSFGWRRPIKRLRPKLCQLFAHRFSSDADNGVSWMSSESSCQRADSRVRPA